MAIASADVAGADEDAAGETLSRIDDSHVIAYIPSPYTGLEYSTGDMSQTMEQTDGGSVRESEEEDKKKQKSRRPASTSFTYIGGRGWNIRRGSLIAYAKRRSSVE